jgi:hypothetical protein
VAYAADMAFDSITAILWPQEIIEILLARLRAAEGLSRSLV